MTLQTVYVAERRKLRAAVTSKDPARILRTVSQARAVFEQAGWPDAWMDWRRAADDAATAARAEGTRDYRRRDALDALADKLDREAASW